MLMERGKGCRGGKGGQEAGASGWLALPDPIEPLMGDGCQESPSLGSKEPQWRNKGRESTFTARQHFTRLKLIWINIDRIKVTCVTALHFFRCF